MKKLIIAVLLASVAGSVYASEKCDAYVKEIDGIMDMAREYAKDAKELKMLDDQMAQMKSMIEQIPEEQREKGCEQAMAQVPMMKQMMEEQIKKLKDAK